MPALDRLRRTDNPARAGVARRLDIQGLRALAVILVVAFHAGLPISGGFIGVDVFFAISGFVITAMLLREMDAHGRIDLTRFYSRRIKRLVPALSVMIVVALAVTVLVPSPLGQPQETIKTAIGAVMMSANVVLQRSVLPGYFARSAQDNALLHTWSLSVEEQYYLIFPAVLMGIWLAAARARRRATLPAAWVLGVSAVLSLTLALAVPHGLPFPGATTKPSAFVFFSATTRAWEFIAGALLALFARRVVLTTSTAWLFFGMGLAAIGVSAVVIDDRGVFPGALAVLPVGGTVLVLAAGIVIGNSPRNPLTASPFVYLGDRSYSWYLWHWPAIVFATQAFGRTLAVTLSAGLLSLIPAALSFAYIENPVRSSPRISTRGSYKLLVACLFVTLTVSGVTERMVHFGWWQPWAMGAHEAMQRDCDKQPVDFRKCTWNAESAGGAVMLVGDSQAWAAADGVIAAASDMGMATTVSATNGCPFIQAETASRVFGVECAASITRTLDHLERVKPAILVLANAESYSVSTLARGYALLLRALPTPRPHVIILRQAPGGDEFTGKRSILVRSGAANRTNTGQAPNPILTKEFADLQGLAYVLDPRDSLCMDRRCRVAVNGDELYSDGNHLSTPGALFLKTQLVQAFQVVQKGRMQP